jgi:replicative DNA helicase
MSEIRHLPIFNIKAANAAALKIIEEERSGKQLGLYSRWSNINRGFSKYFRFGLNTLIAGGSGSGKSTLLNNIIQDFTAFEYLKDLDGNIIQEPINAFYKDKLVHLHFAFEMSAHNEILRMLSSQMLVSYTELLSSQIQQDNESFGRLSDNQYELVKVLMDMNKRRPILFCELPGNIYQIYETIAYVYKEYKAKFGTDDFKLSISLDHTLLTDKLDERNSMEIIANLGKIFIKVRKDFNALSIILSQFNGDIESPLRKTNPVFHYPIKEDIYGSKEIYFAMDNVVLAHNPSKLNLLAYGTLKYDTRQLIHFLIEKQRFGNTGSLWMRSDFKNSRFLEYESGKPPIYQSTNTLP